MRFIDSVLCTAIVILVSLGGNALSQDTPSPDDNLSGLSSAPEDQPRIERLFEELIAPANEDLSALGELLRPANTEGPRETLVSFLELTQRYYDLLVQDTYTPEDAAELQHLYDQMQSYFDLRDVAPSLRRDVAVNAAVYLREVIDRVGLPPLEEIPDQQAMLAAMEEGSPTSWKLGNSSLQIVRVDEGSNEGQYVFDQETLNAAEDLYWSLRPFPYRTTLAEDFYEASFLTPDPTLQAWTDGLPGWMHRGILGQTIWQWIGMVGLFVVGFLLIWLVWTGLKRMTRNVSPVTRDSALLLVPIFTVLVSYVLYDLVGDKIFVTGMVFQFAVYAIYGMALIAVVFFIFSLGTVISELTTLTNFAKRRPSDVHLVNLGVRVLSVLVIIAVVLQGMYLMGFSLASIIASAGVTGLAVALAAQNTLR